MGNSGWGCLAVRVFQENAGSLPKAMGSLCRNGCGLAYLRCGRSFRPVALCLAKIEPFYWGNWRSREREMGREWNGNGKRECETGTGTGTEREWEREIRLVAIIIHCIMEALPLSLET